MVTSVAHDGSCRLRAGAYYLSPTLARAGGLGRANPALLCPGVTFLLLSQRTAGQQRIGKGAEEAVPTQLPLAAQ